MRYAALACVLVALLTSLGLMQRAAQAAAHRDEQQADSNDVVVALTFVGCAIVIALLGVTLAILA